MKSWVFLLVAIVSEVIGTTALKQSDSFTRLIPTVICAISFASAFYFLSLTLRTIPVGIAYAVWSGLGVVLIALIGWKVFGQALDWPAVVGIILILSGVLVMNLFSAQAGH